jgi:hypothetical protein
MPAAFKHTPSLAAEHCHSCPHKPTPEVHAEQTLQTNSQAPALSHRRQGRRYAPCSRRLQATGFQPPPEPLRPTTSNAALLPLARRLAPHDFAYLPDSLTASGRAAHAKPRVNDLANHLSRTQPPWLYHLQLPLEVAQTSYSPCSTFSKTRRAFCTAAERLI